MQLTCYSKLSTRIFALIGQMLNVAAITGSPSK